MVYPVYEKEVLNDKKKNGLKNGAGAYRKWSA